MSIGIQEIVALSIVTVIVCFALYRRWRRGHAKSAGCSTCENQADNSGTETGEVQIHLYRHQD